jgi:DNA-binding transcriptional LysR family regulator
LIVAKLGRLHVYPFAAQSYLDMYGVPQSYEDMTKHRLVEQVAPQLEPTALARYFHLDTTDQVTGVRTNTSTAHFYAVEKGAGIGVLPTYALCLGAPVVPVDIGEGYSLDVWMTYHPEVRKCRHRSVAIEWIKSMFDPVQYPWFRDRFIHPRALLNLMPKAARINDGRGFLATDPARPPARKKSATR